MTQSKVQGASFRVSKLKVNFSVLHVGRGWLITIMDLQQDDSESKNYKSVVVSSCCDPSHSARVYRYAIAFFIFLANTCLFFAVELPSGLQKIILNVLDIDAKQYNLLFSISTWPDVVLSVFGGLLVDRVIGIRVGVLLVAVVGVVGKAIFTIGGFFSSYVVILLGRVVFGCGIWLFKNMLFVIIALWFKGKEINLMASLCSSAIRTGASIGIVLPHIFYANLNFIQFRLGMTFSLGLLAVLIAAISAIVIVILDKRGAKLTEREEKKRRKFSTSDLKDFSPAFWLCTLSLAIFLSVMISFSSNGQFFVTSKFAGFEPNQANLANVLIYTCPIIVTPFIGIFLDLIGYNIVFAVVGLMIALLAHVLYIGSDDTMLCTPFLVGTIYSLSYSISSTSLWPIPVFIVQEHQLTTAYSIFNMEFCLCLSLISFFTGFLIDNVGFFFLEIYFIILLFFACAFLSVVILIDLSLPHRVLLIPGLIKECQCN